MRITVVFEETRLILDVQPEDKVKVLKKRVRAKLANEVTEDKKVGKYLEMRFGGAPLQNDWVLQDIGITSGSTVKCDLKTVQKAKLIICLGYNQGTLSITDDIDPLLMKVGQLRSVLSHKLGIPVSIFRLSFESTVNDEPSPLITQRDFNNVKNKQANKTNEIFDANTLDYYGIEIGSKIKLDLWDGWNELLLTSIAGHDSIVPQYFSWDREIRHFQQRVSLYVASFHGHVGLAAAMLKYGAKAHEPVGTHPSRKWCSETEHPECLKCPLHVACEKGHLPLLRLFVKSSPLCFICKDAQGRTPLQIVLRHRHRACFEFLIARQWGRKTGKNFSFTITLYCRILLWCEKAKARVFLLHGTAKSSYRGLPPREGALVGTEVLVDGYSSKPANSVPFHLVPKPEISPEQLMTALALSQRKLKIMRKRRSKAYMHSGRASIVSIATNERRKRLTSAGTVTSISSNTTTRKNSISTIDSSPDNKFCSEREMLRSGNLRVSIKTLSQNSTSDAYERTALNKATANKENSIPGNVTCKTQPSLQLVSAQTKKHNSVRNEISLPHLPGIVQNNETFANKSLSRRESKISFKPANFSESVSVFRKKASYRGLNLLSQSSLSSLPPPAVKRPVALPQTKTIETAIPLPSKSREHHLKPFFYWSSNEANENPVEETLQRYKAYRGMEPRQNAVQCLAVTSSFTEKPWLQQLRMAVCLTKRGVKRNISTQSVAVSN